MIIKVDVSVTAPELAESIIQLARAYSQVDLGGVIAKGKVMVRETEPLKVVDENEEVEASENGHEQGPKSEEILNNEVNKKTVSEKQENEDSQNVSLEEVRAKLAALSLEGKQVQVKALIAGFGAKKLSEIPSNQYTTLLEKAGVL